MSVPISPALAGKIDSAAETFYHRLDDLAPEGIHAGQWYKVVADIAGPIRGYKDWMNEVWETVE